VLTAILGGEEARDLMPVTLQTVIPATLLSDSMPHPIDAAKNENNTVN
jgi:hypothetical protein